MNRLYERLTPTERFQIAVEAFGRGDLAEVDRLNDTTPSGTFKVQEPSYFDRLQRITWLALYVAVQARDPEAAAIAAYVALVLRTTRTEDRDGDADADGSKFDELCQICVERISRLKALSSAWESVCTGAGVSARDIDKMIGLPLRESGNTLQLIEETLEEVAPGEDYRRHCLDHMTRFWAAKILDRYPE